MRSGVINPYDGDLTFVGRVVGSLPVDVHIGKLMLLGYVFGCLEECIVIGEFLKRSSFPAHRVLAFTRNSLCRAPSREMPVLAREKQFFFL